MTVFEWVGKSEDGNTITLKRLEIAKMFRFPDYANEAWLSANKELIRNGAVLDVETTGLSHENDQVIEVGVRQFQFNRDTGEILSLGKHYSGFQDPGEPLSEEIKTLTGITDEMVKGQSIDWAQVTAIIETSQVVIAHNASFDRPFIDAKSPVSSERIWACSLQQVDWQKKGLPSQKLDVLSLYHGFFNDSHRALNDADSLLYLLSQNDQQVKLPYFLELISEARKTMATVYATYAPFETKEALRERRYRWNPQEKVWSKKIAKDTLPTELEWLSDSIYRGPFRGRVDEIHAKDQFKAERNRG